MSNNPTAPPARRLRRPGRFLAVVSLSLLAALAAAAPAGATGPASDPESASFEVEFLEGMIDHHQMALHMSELCLEKAVHEDLAALCGSIMESQAAEIAEMQGWLSDWYGIDHEPAMDDPAHQQQMAELRELSGEEFEIAFLRMMSEHHAMAVDEGLACLRSAEHRQLIGLCSGIVVTQSREVAQMEMWLCRWYGDCSFARLRSLAA